MKYDMVILVMIFLNSLKIIQGKRHATEEPKQNVKNDKEFTADKDTSLPESHKEALDKMLGAFLNDQDSDGSIFKYLFGIGNEKPSSIDFDNLDIATLDTDSIKKIVQRAKKRYETLQTRRLQYTPKLGLDLLENPEREYSQYSSYAEKRSALDKRKDYVIIAFDLMAQSIYSTRYRLIETKEHRRKYAKDVPYQIGVMVGSIMELKNKMAHMYANMYWMETRTHFIWYLILYEKMLTAFTDIENQVDRIFMVHKKFIKETRNSNTKGSEFSQGREDLKNKQPSP